MKIGIMLRHFNQHGGGVKNYTNYLLDELFKLNSEHEFFLIYNNPEFIGTYNHHENVTEISIKISSRLLWDQIGVPWIHHKEKFDIIFAMGNQTLRSNLSKIYLSPVCISSYVNYFCFKFHKEESDRFSKCRKR